MSERTKARLKRIRRDRACLPSCVEAVLTSAAIAMLQSHDGRQAWRGLETSIEVLANSAWRHCAAGNSLAELRCLGEQPAPRRRRRVWPEEAFRDSWRTDSIGAELPTAAYLFRLSDGGLGLIDATADPEARRCSSPRLHASGGTVTRCAPFSSRTGFDDHTAGAQAFPEAEVYAHGKADPTVPAKSAME